MFRGRDWTFLLLVAALPLLGYQFAIGNQVEQFTIVRRLADPGFLPGDFYVDSASTFGPRYYYSLLLAWLTQAAPLPAVILVLTFLTNLALAAVGFDAARRHLGAAPIGGAIAALLSIANSSFALGFAGYLRFDSYQPANGAIALALIGASLLIAGRRLWAAPAFAAAALLHPLIGVEVAVIAFGACALAEVVRHKTPVAIGRAWLSYAPSGLIFSLAVAAAWILPGLGQEAARIPDAEFFHILAEFRAPHHYLAREMPAGQFLRAGVFAVATAWMVWLKLRREGLAFGPVALAAAGLIVLGLCAASVLLVDILHQRAFVTAQLFRMLLVLKWVGFLLFAWIAADWLKSPTALKIVAAAAPILVTGEAQPLVMLASIAAVEGARALRLHSLLAWLAAILLGALAARQQLLDGQWEELGRAAIGLVILVAFYLSARVLFRTGAAAILGLMIAFGVANRDLGHDFRSDVFEPNYGFGDLKTPAADIARWARTASPKDSVWITPPDFEAFRLIAERPIVADFTSLPFQDAAMREWRDRMAALYGEPQGGGFAALGAMRRHYREGDLARLGGAAQRYGATHAVLYADTPWPGPVLYANEEFKAVRIAEGAP